MFLPPKSLVISKSPAKNPPSTRDVDGDGGLIAGDSKPQVISH
jgi:hypothetical protein